MEIVLPAPCLAVNIGISGSGKSTFARKHFAPSEVISSDHYRQMICNHPHSMEATSDAFDLVYTIAKMRLKRGLFALIDSTAVETFAREDLLGIAKEMGVPAVGFAYDIPLDVCLVRDERREYTVGERVIREQFAHLQDSKALFAAEGWHSLHWIDLASQDSATVKFSTAKQSPESLDEEPHEEVSAIA